MQIRGPFGNFHRAQQKKYGVWGLLQDANGFFDGLTCILSTSEHQNLRSACTRIIHFQFNILITTEGPLRSTLPQGIQRATGAPSSICKSNSYFKFMHYAADTMSRYCKLFSQYPFFCFLFLACGGPVWCVGPQSLMRHWKKMLVTLKKRSGKQDLNFLKISSVYL